MEGCKVFLAAQATETNLQQIAVTEESARKYLVWPHREILAELNESEKAKQAKHIDTHLVFEYNEGDEILGYRAPRSNRFYFVHDPNGAKFAQMDIYHSKVK